MELVHMQLLLVTLYKYVVIVKVTTNSWLQTSKQIATGHRSAKKSENHHKQNIRAVLCTNNGLIYGCITGVCDRIVAS